jgi:cyclase
MKLVEVKPNVFFVDAPGPASNVLYLKTVEGVVLVDTTTSSDDIRSALDLGGVLVEDVCMLINTHADGDHIGGNSLFTSPRYAHQITLDRMVEAKRPENELPTITFSEKKMGFSVGQFSIELIHTGGHKPEQTIVWIPSHRVILASDLLFQGRYPFMMSSIVPDWIAALKSLKEYDAEVVLPGHGTVCSYKEVDELLDYMETSFALAEEHVKKGDSLEETLRDPDFPRPTGWDREMLADKNIEIFYEQAK